MSETPTVLWSRPENERAGSPLLVMFHGYGADEADLFALASQLPAEFTVACVRAPQQAGPGYAWFPLRTDLTYSLDAVIDTAASIEAWLDSVRGAHSSVTLLGFSQGMCMATTLMRHRPADYAAVVGLSGFVVTAERNPYFDDATTGTVKPPLFWAETRATPSSLPNQWSSPTAGCVAIQRSRRSSIPGSGTASTPRKWHT
ncbi:hypothetical protein GCM10025779_20180 [Arthrobacter cryoconiti]|nr:phospholipase [Arthrobacter cryoconiti]MCC9067137.1 phospholipase [Arthrobacter cryoconiti]